MLGISSSLSNKNFVKRPVITATTFVSGSSDYIVVSNHVDLQVAPGSGVGSDFSVSFWFKPTEDASSTSDKTGFIGPMMGVFRGGGFYVDYHDDSGADQHIRFVSGTGGDIMESTFTPILHNVWYHIAITYDVSATTAKMYINGVLDLTVTDQAAPAQYTGDIHIGASSTGSKYVSSVTSEIAYWKGTVLSSDDIELLYSESPDMRYLNPAPTAYWLLDENSATGSDKVIDEMETHHGTSSGLADADFDTADTPTGV